MRDDYFKHLLAGMLIAFTVIALFSPPNFVGFGCAVVIGGVKELVWDKWMKKGTPELMDFFWTAFGGFSIELLYLL